MTRRREFLKTVAGLGRLGSATKERTGHGVTGIAAARMIVGRGELGAVHFCRIAHPGLRDAAASVLNRADCVMEIDPHAEGAAFLGSRGTLMVCRGDWRVFARES